MNQTTLKCPKCGSMVKSVVKDSRSPMTGDYIRRRRQCGACGHKYSSREIIWDFDANASDPNAIKPEDVLSLRALAVEILNRTNWLVPSADSVRPAGSSGR